MDRIDKIIDKLAVTSRNEIVPQLDVSDIVMARIIALQRQKVGLLPLEIFAGASAVAASIVMYFSIQAWQTIVNPLFQLLTPYQGVTLW